MTFNFVLSRMLQQDSVIVAETFFITFNTTWKSKNEKTKAFNDRSISMNLLTTLRSWYFSLRASNQNTKDVSLFY